MGGYERRSRRPSCRTAPAGLDGIPADFNGRLLEDDWDRFEEIAENSRRRVPAMDEVKITKLINGPEAFTPDNEFCLGESEVARALRRRGLLRPRARGRRRHRLGDRRVDRRGRAEPRPLGDGRAAVRRPVPFARPTRTPAPARPTRPTTTSATRTTSARRGARCGSPPANAWHREHGAAFGEKSGWERVNWYELQRPCRGGDESLRPRGWAGQHWSPAIGAEHRATREAVAIFDESSFAKLEIAGPGAAALVERLCDNRVARDVGKLTYTQMLNERGGIECDFTVARLGEELFSIVTGTAFGNHDRDGSASTCPTMARRRYAT